METVVRGKNLRVPTDLRARAVEKLRRLERLAHDIRRIEVDFSEVRNPRVARNHVCEATVHLTKHFVKAHAAATDPAAALELVVDKVEHQVSRLKGKRVGRAHPRHGRSTADAEPLADIGAEAGTETETVGLDGSADEDGAARLVRTKRFAMKPMTVEEATLQMELLGHDFFLFTSAQTGRAAVLYRRRDGDLGLIEAVG